jgi:hypothetical protein
VARQPPRVRDAQGRYPRGGPTSQPARAQPLVADVVVTSDSEVVAVALDGSVGRVVRAIATDVIVELVGATPVDTGFAQACWIGSIGAPSSAVGGSKKEVDVGPQEKSIEEIQVYELSQGQVFINNNCGYIMRLNDGWSSQAPAGFVESSLEKAALGLDGVQL